MKFGFTQEMIKKIWTIFLSGVIIVSIYFLIEHLDIVKNTVQTMFSLVTPLVIGFCIAFVLNPLKYLIERTLLSKLSIKPGLKRAISVVLTLLIFILILVSLAFIIIPNIIGSLVSFYQHFDEYAQTVQAFMNDFNQRFNLPEQIQSIFDSTVSEVISFMQSYLRDNLPSLINASISAAASLMNVVIGFIISIYILIDHEKFALKIKRLNYAIFPRRVADYLVYVTQLTSKTYNGFIIGKSIDSLCVWAICYGMLRLFNIQYAGLISLIIAITNFIPVFGPYLGAIPVAFLLLMVNPGQSLIFVIMIFIIQQVDHTYILPRFLKNSLGLPTFWILVAMVIGAGFFGILGMFLAVPLFAVVYKIVSAHINEHVVMDKEVIDEIYQD